MSVKVDQRKIYRENLLSGNARINPSIEFKIEQLQKKISNLSAISTICETKGSLIKGQ